MNKVYIFAFSFCFLLLNLNPTFAEVLYTKDLNADGVNDSNIVATSTCTTVQNYYCLRITSGVYVNFEVPVFEKATITVANISEQGNMGPNGTQLSNWFSIWDLTYSNNTKQSVLVISNLNTRTTISKVYAPLGWSAGNIYFGTISDPTGNKYPFIAPQYHTYTTIVDPKDPLVASTGSIDITQWKNLCIYNPSKTVVDSCGSVGFSAVNTFPSFSGPQTPEEMHFMTTNAFRYAGGYTYDNNGDGWTDIHLPYTSHIFSISGQKALLESLTSTTTYKADMSENFYDVDRQTGELLRYHGGRMYASWTGFKVGVTRKLLAVFGNPIGSFLNHNANLINGVQVSSVDSSNYLNDEWRYDYSHVGHVFRASSLDSSRPVIRTGDGYNNAIHRFKDGVIKVNGVSKYVMYNMFEGPKMTHECDDIARANTDAFVFNACLRKYQMNQLGTWYAVVRDLQDAGKIVYKVPNVYVWGWSDKMMPGTEPIFLLEKLDGKVPYYIGATSDFYADNDRVPIIKYARFDTTKTTDPFVLSGSFQFPGFIVMKGSTNVNNAVDNGNTSSGYSEFYDNDYNADGLIDLKVKMASGDYFKVVYDSSLASFKMIQNNASTAIPSSVPATIVDYSVVGTSPDNILVSKSQIVTLKQGSNGYITWNVKNALSCDVVTPERTFTNFKSFTDYTTFKNITQSFVAKISCKDLNGVVSAVKQMEIIVQNSTTVSTPTVSISTDPQTISSGNSAVLNWSSTNSTNCTLNSTESVGTTGTRIVNPTSTTVYGLVCANAIGQSANTSTTLTVTTPIPSATPATITNFTVNGIGPAGSTVSGTQSVILKSGTSGSIVWNVKDAKSCDIVTPNYTFNNFPSLNDYTTFSNITQNFTAKITCKDKSGVVSATKQVVISIESQTPQTPSATPVLIENFQVNGTSPQGGPAVNGETMTLKYGSSGTVMWNVKNASTCDIVTPNYTFNNFSSLNDNTSFTNITQNFTVKITCRDSNGVVSANKQINIQVQANSTGPISSTTPATITNFQVSGTSPAGSPVTSTQSLTLKSGSSGGIMWNVKDASTCDIVTPNYTFNNFPSLNDYTTFSNITQNFTAKITCKDTNGVVSATKEVSITVQ